MLLRWKFLMHLAVICPVFAFMVGKTVVFTFSHTQGTHIPLRGSLHYFFRYDLE